MTLLRGEWPWMDREPAKKEEFEDVLKLVNYVFRESRGALPDMKHKNAVIYYEPNMDDFQIVVEDGKPVSHIAITETDVSIYGYETRIGHVGDVCTDPEYRGKGYATLLLEHCEKKFCDDGVDIVRISGGRGLYVRAGYVHAGLTRSFAISQEEANRDEQEVDLVPYREDDLGTVIALYGKETGKIPSPSRHVSEGPAKFPGEYMQFPTVFSYPTWETSPRMPSSWRIPFRAGAREKRVLRYCGIRGRLEATIAGAARQIARTVGAEILHVTVPFDDRGLIAALTQSGLESSAHAAGGTTKILDLPRLMTRMRGYIEERIGHRDREILSGSIRRATAMPSMSVRARSRPTPAPSRALCLATGATRATISIHPTERSPKRLRHIFPLPLPKPGLNHI